MSSHLPTRTPLQVTLSVWHALFLREALARTTGDRLAWFWMLFEPIAMVAVMAAVRGYAMGERHIFGAPFIPWLVTGMLGFFLFRENMLRSMGAINASKGLFSYRQVKPVDAVINRCFVEGMLKSFIFLLFVAAGILLQQDMLTDRPLEAFIAWTSLWCLGLGVGLMLSVVATLVSEIAKIIQVTTFPLLILSGAIIPIQALPASMHGYLLLNPAAHGIELFRTAYFSGYHTLAGVNYLYLWTFTLASTALGLMLHIRFENKLKAK